MFIALPVTHRTMAPIVMACLAGWYAVALGVGCFLSCRLQRTMREEERLREIRMHASAYTEEDEEERRTADEKEEDHEEDEDDYSNEHIWRMYYSNKIMFMAPIAIACLVGYAALISLECFVAHRRHRQGRMRGEECTCEMMKYFR
ncbi:hypothetical protein PRIPAC_86200 [Pristionchus pacificus]|uniref:Uncharacterized protein n=1 Tax=Pristionchus pacificus TaxID=54126 RepID=A0A2A6BRQ7_PRIPA|nr:hypothetical protein PRIPAC_86200 [Pristionchus pacificus]|eukprot:PDM68590.1 hypothetical protein PRIPAC_46892 [Pristionchus pacificus]